MMATMKPLPGAARGYWRARLAAQAVGALILAALVTDSAEVELGPFLLVAVLLAVVAVVVVPAVRWRRWAYEIRDEEIELRHGTFVARRTLVPIRRVQHVDSEQGPLQGSFGLAAVTFHTAAGKVSIPALGVSEADRVRRRVAELARTLDDV
jgi:membrane protein YdbS with pleckstrin-like domain